MADFYFIFFMDWFDAYYALVDFRARVVKFHFPKDLILEWKSFSAVPKDRLFRKLRQES